MYCRYISIAKDPNGSVVQLYNVTGVLTGPGVLTAEADGINPATVSFSEYSEKLASQTDIIGFDWKILNGTSWVIDPDKVFFVKTVDNRIWKLRFIDFEGASTGVSVFEKTDLGLFSATNEWPGMELNIYPNPASEILTISMQHGQQTSLKIQITDAAGKQINQFDLAGREGFRVVEIPVYDLPEGNYILTIDGAGKRISRTFVKQ